MNDLLIFLYIFYPEAFPPKDMFDVLRRENFGKQEVEGMKSFGRKIVWSVYIFLHNKKIPNLKKLINTFDEDV